eukprot:6971981-Prymnesium_polylepis.1
MAIYQELLGLVFRELPAGAFPRWHESVRLFIVVPPPRLELLRAPRAAPARPPRSPRAALATPLRLEAAELSGRASDWAVHPIGPCL